MIVTRVPLRVSLFGGGTDLPEFYKRTDGKVLNFAINKYIYVVSHPEFQDRLRLAYSEVENVTSVEEVRHRLFKAVLQYSNVQQGIEVGTFADIPSSGSGLGSSSAFTVGLLANLALSSGRELSQESYAESAFDIERNILNDPVGKQDHYGAALGGMKVLEFFKSGEVRVSRLRNEVKIRELVENSFKLIYTNQNRNAIPILKVQQEEIINSDISFQRLVDLIPVVDRGLLALHENNLHKIGDLLDYSWQLKKKLHRFVSNESIDSLYDSLRGQGMLGGKLLGAGGGGFLLGVAQPDVWKSIRKNSLSLRIIDISLDEHGVTSWRI